MAVILGATLTHRRSVVTQLMTVAGAQVLASMQTAGHMAEQYEFEDPAGSWIDLVNACRLDGEVARRSAINRCLLVARNSHWNERLWQEEVELAEVEYGGDLGESDMTEPNTSDYVEQ